MTYTHMGVQILLVCKDKKLSAGGRSKLEQAFQMCLGFLVPTLMFWPYVLSPSLPEAWLEFSWSQIPSSPEKLSRWLQQQWQDWSPCYTPWQVTNLATTSGGSCGLASLLCMEWWCMWSACPGPPSMKISGAMATSPILAWLSVLKKVLAVL